MVITIEECGLLEILTMCWIISGLFCIFVIKEDLLENAIKSDMNLVGKIISIIFLIVIAPIPYLIIAICMIIDFLFYIKIKKEK